MSTPSIALLSHEQLREKVISLEAENATLKATVKEALTWVQVMDGHKPFEAPDMCGEMVSIRLTGLCMLAEIVRPGCRTIANARFMTDWQHSVKAGHPASDDLPDFLKRK